MCLSGMNIHSHFLKNLLFQAKKAKENVKRKKVEHLSSTKEHESFGLIWHMLGLTCHWVPIVISLSSLWVLPRLAHVTRTQCSAAESGEQFQTSHVNPSDKTVYIPLGGGGMSE